MAEIEEMESAQEDEFASLLESLEQDSIDRAEAEGPGTENPAYELYRTVLYQPDFELMENLKDMDEFIDFVADFESDFAQEMNKLESGKPGLGNLIVAINPAQVRTWLVIDDWLPAQEMLKAKDAALRKNPPPGVRKSVVLFAICFNMFGANGGEDGFSEIPLPQDWLDHSSEEGEQVAVLVQRSWETGK